MMAPQVTTDRFPRKFLSIQGPLPEIGPSHHGPASRKPSGDFPTGLHGDRLSQVYWEKPQG